MRNASRDEADPYKNYTADVVLHGNLLLTITHHPELSFRQPPPLSDSCLSKQLEQIICELYTVGGWKNHYYDIP